MNYRHITILGLIALAFIIAVYDTAAAASSQDGSTITSVIRGAARAYPILPFVAGVLMGHLFWNS